MGQSAVIALAKSFNGFATWTFSQESFSTWRHYRSMGICAGLSAQWIYYHAIGDSLGNHLGSGGLGDLSVPMLHRIRDFHNTRSTGTGDEQSRLLGVWLTGNGIPQLRTSLMFGVMPLFVADYHKITYGPGVARCSCGVFEVKRNDAGELRRLAEKHVKDNPKVGTSTPSEISSKASERRISEVHIVNAMRAMKRGCYARVNFGGTVVGYGAGHSVAVWLGAKTFRTKIRYISQLRPAQGASRQQHSIPAPEASGSVVKWQDDSWDDGPSKPYRQTNVSAYSLPAGGAGLAVGRRPDPTMMETKIETSPGDAAFFDPNFGEFWFERNSDFFNFFEVFYRRNYLSFPYKFNQNYEVIFHARTAASDDLDRVARR